jgi:biopolymer transport protein ExbD
MAFKPQGDEQDTMSEINVTPLVDVMLVLVIILLVTAPLLTQSVHVSLPKTTTTTPDVDVKDQPLQLGIDAQGLITLNKTPYADLAALETALKAEVAKNPEVAVHLYADQAVVYKNVAQVMATAQHAGVSKLAFVSVEQ